MTLILVADRPVTRCPDCDGPLSLPIRSRKPGFVVQTCKNLPRCGKTVRTRVEDVVLEPDVDDGRRHGRFQLPSPHEPEPTYSTEPNWTPIGKITPAELDALNLRDRKLAAAGGDR